MWEAGFMAFCAFHTLSSRPAYRADGPHGKAVKSRGPKTTRAMQSGELRAGLDPDIVLDALYGPFYHRLLVPYKNGVISDAFIDALVDMVFNGLKPSAGEA